MIWHFNRCIFPHAEDCNVGITHYAIIGVAPTTKGPFSAKVSVSIVIFYNGLCGIGIINQIALVWNVFIRIGWQNCFIWNIATPRINYLIIRHFNGGILPCAFNRHVGISHYATIWIGPATKAPLATNVAILVIIVN